MGCNNLDSHRQRFQGALDTEMSAYDLDLALTRAKALLEQPEASVALLAAEDELAFGPALSRGFDFEGYDPVAIPIDPKIRKFEELRDLLGLIVNAGRWALGPPIGEREEFRWHERFASRFCYELVFRDGAPQKVALFADFGTGLYHSRYIAKALRDNRFPYAIHLGDVYCAGRAEKMDRYFTAELDPMLDRTKLFALLVNHEMFSRGRPWFAALERRLADNPLQEQEGSYFCLRNAELQLIGVDTEFFGHGRYRDPGLVAWLGVQLAFGRAHGLTNVLLTGNEPYTYGKLRRTKLLTEDLAWAKDSIDLWFWGNTHYCAFFGSGGDLPFFGSCIGYAGFPYRREVAGSESTAPVLWLETEARFPAWTNVRQDRGNNGYCTLDWDAGAVRIAYRDWMARELCAVMLARSADGRLTVQRVLPAV